LEGGEEKFLLVRENPTGKKDSSKIDIENHSKSRKKESEGTESSLTGAKET